MPKGQIYQVTTYRLPSGNNFAFVYYASGRVIRYSYFNPFCNDLPKSVVDFLNSDLVYVSRRYATTYLSNCGETIVEVFSIRGCLSHG